MSRYYGDFRSIDTSNDPDGQKYRVLIFTNYTGTNPYEYVSIEIPGDGETQLIRYPIKGTSITMGENPFNVEYNGDAENIYKPYISSSATTEFVQSTINLDFLNTTGTQTLVVLLKWKPEVSEVNGCMYNASTGATLNKKYVAYQGDVYFNDYEPYKFDAFCYDVEWVGFSSPETYSLNFDHLTEAFELNAQDAFSTLKYQKYQWMGDTSTMAVSIKDIILNALASLKAYKKVYLTKSLKLIGDSSSLISRIYAQQSNFFDEDNEPSTVCDVVENVLRYAGLTLIPYKNSVIITTPDAIRENWNSFEVYELPDSGYFMNFGECTYSQSIDENLQSVHIIDGSTFSLSGTQISTSNVYNSVSTTNDMYYIDNVTPDLSDNNNVGNISYNNSNVLHDSSRYYWKFNALESAISTFKTYQYSPDVLTLNNGVYNVTFSTTEIENPSYILTTMGYRPTCVLMDTTSVNKGSSTDNKTRKIYFHSFPYSNAQSLNFQFTDINAEEKKQPMIYIESKHFFVNDDVYVNIKGNIEFYSFPTDTSYIDVKSMYPHNFDELTNKVVNNYEFIWSKIRCGNKYLINSTAKGVYGWSDNESYVKVWFRVEKDENDELPEAFGKSFSILSNRNDEDGIIMKLPTSTNFQNLSITLYRTIGFSNVVSMSSALLSGFDVKLISGSELYDEYYDKENNIEYKSEINVNAIEEYSDNSLKLATDSSHLPNYSQVVKSMDGSTFATMSSIYNVATGRYTIPERQYNHNVAKQYTSPTIHLTLNAHNGLMTPYTRVTWGQIPNVVFTVNAISTDFKYETDRVSLVQIKDSSVATTDTIRNRTRNYRRNADVIAHNRKAKTERQTLDSIISVPSDSSLYSINGIMRIRTSEESIEGATTTGVDFTDGQLLISVPDSVTMSFDSSDGYLIGTINN